MIRPCDERDLDEMYAIINEAARAYEGVIPADCYHQPYMPMAEVRREAARMTFFGWEEDGQLTGVVGWEPVRDVTLVRHCYVLSDRQRQGVGSALVRHAMARTRSRRLLNGCSTRRATEGGPKPFPVASRRGRSIFSRSTST